MIEFIAYIVSMGLFIYLMYKRVMSESEKPAGPPGSKDPLTQFLESLDDDELHVKKEVPAAPQKKKLKIASVPPLRPSEESYEKRFSGHSVVSRHYQELANATPPEVTIKAKPSRGELLLHGLKSKKQMVIYAELIGRPKGYWT